jgi:hypothetical protein
MAVVVAAGCAADHGDYRILATRFATRTRRNRRRRQDFVLALTGSNDIAEAHRSPVAITEGANRAFPSDGSKANKVEPQSVKIITSLNPPANHVSCDCSRFVHRCESSSWGRGCGLYATQQCSRPGAQYWETYESYLHRATRLRRSA